MNQFDRVERYLNRIRKVYSGQNLIMWDERETVEDDILSFFIHCHHLSDWITTLNKLGLTHRDLKEFIESHEELKLCADIANLSKHCRLTKKRWSRSSPRVTGRRFESNGNADLPGVTGRFIITTHSEVIDVLDLAEACWRHWSDLKSNLALESIKIKAR